MRHATATAADVRAVATAFALTWLNPHVYLDTVLLLGSIANQHGDVGRWWFAAGAAVASVLWFVGLGYGARRAHRLLSSRALVAGAGRADRPDHAGDRPDAGHVLRRHRGEVSTSSTDVGRACRDPVEKRLSVDAHAVDAQCLGDGLEVGRPAARAVAAAARGETDGGGAGEQRAAAVTGLGADVGADQAADAALGVVHRRVQAPARCRRGRRWCCRCG